ncbi:unnamed protein product [Tilletia controversa]|uniref:Uncharacterized protein n=1 Tax=Tilletia controversa TaxID=13291 RepID=A0A8X7MM91_9BASI|nr:hypothetical protein A4X06_0g7457 [Tilletia controversa]CAD6984810.1 unnamed protein product [Tilletia controversa]
MPTKGGPPGQEDGKQIKNVDLMLRTAPLVAPPGPFRSHSGSSFDPGGSLKANVSSVLSASLEPSTRGKYGTGIRAFKAFCDSLDVPLSDRFPISRDLLFAFVCSFAGKVRRKVVSGYLTGLSSRHAMWNQPWSRHKCVTVALQGIARLASPPSDDRRPTPPR